VVAYTRETVDQIVVVAINPGDESATLALPDLPGIGGWQVALTTIGPDTPSTMLEPGSTTILGANEALILEAR
jgi:hypothetical protein